HRDGRQKDLRSARPDVPRGLARVVGRALAREPSKRYAGAAEMTTALAALSPSSSRTRWALTGAAVLLGLALSVGVISFSLRIGGHAEPSAEPAGAASVVTRGAGVTIPQTSASASSDHNSENIAAALRFEARDWVLIVPFENQTGDRYVDGTL